MADKIVVVKGGGVGSVFWGLFLFFIVLPVIATIGCFACAGTVVSEAMKQAKEAEERNNRQFETPPQIEMRVWRTADGKHSREAEFVTIEGDKVRLRKSDGTEVTLDIARLSDEDKAYIDSKR